MIVPSWLFWILAVAAVLAAVLAVLLWSSRRQRYTRVPTAVLETPERLGVVLAGLTGAWPSEGNRVEVLRDGEGFYPALIAAIGGAERSVHLEVFAWWRGAVCHRVAEALAERARAGVAVRLLVDAIGSFEMEPELIDELRATGVQVVWFHPFRFRTLGRLNKRDHRKLAVVDGATAFVFGHGIAGEWDQGPDSEPPWRDLALRITGPATRQLQSVFAQNWMEESSELLADPDDFPESAPQGPLPLHVIASSPRGGVSNSSLYYRLMIAGAQRDLVLQNPYFAPGPEVAAMLEAAAQRGVRIRILLPGRFTDSPIVQRAGQRLFDRMLEAGVELYQSQQAFCHHKVLVVDGHWSYVGSANFDERSFDINAELGVAIPDPTFAAQLLDQVLPLFAPAEAERITIESWRQRSSWSRLVERFAYLLHDQL